MTANYIAPGVFTASECATYLCINADEVRRLLKVGELKGWRTQGVDRGDWRISRAAADEWIALQEERAIQEATR